MSVTGIIILAWVLIVETYKKTNSLVGCQLLDWGRVNTESRESHWWFTDWTGTDRAEVAHWRQISWHCRKDDKPERFYWEVTEGLLPVVEIPTLRQDERGKSFFKLCIASELASEKWMPCKSSQCIFLNNFCGINVFSKLCWRAGNDVGLLADVMIYEL